MPGCDRPLHSLAGHHVVTPITRDRLTSARHGRGPHAPPASIRWVPFLGLAAADVRAAEQDVQALLSKVDVSEPGYGTRTFGEPKINVFMGEHDSVLLIYQARFGGDGDHTENRTKVFRFTHGEPKKVLDQNFDSVSFVEAGGVLKTIRGNVVESLCPRVRWTRRRGARGHLPHPRCRGAADDLGCSNPRRKRKGGPSGEAPRARE